MPGAAAGEPATDRLRDIGGFGPNPGGLRMRAFIPPALAPGAPLLVALHGCTQTAPGFDHGCGWSVLAERMGFALLAPEQRKANNPNRCFNWFEPGDTARGAGEAESIRRMVAHMLAEHRLDPQRVFVAGLSAGGAMASVMLATHPDLFAAGAIIAGLPYGAAGNMQQAFEAMGTGRSRPAAEWAGLVRAASPHRGRWPRVSVWQGEADTTVRPVNAAEIVKQWTHLHGLTAAPRTEGGARGHVRRVWHGPDGTPLVEHHSLPGLAHGVPIHPGEGEGRCGVAMPFILDAGISAPHRIATFFGLGGAEGTGAGAGRVVPDNGPAACPAPGVIHVGRNGEARAWPEAEEARPEASAGSSAGEDPGVGGVIRRALAAAGLLRP